MKTDRIGFIGGGNIAGAIIGGMIKSGYIKPDLITVFDTDAAKLERLNSTYGVRRADSAADVVVNCKYVFLTVKPQVYESVLSEIAELISDDTCLVAVAAGVTISFVKSIAGKNCKVIRVMPNTPLLIGKGASALVHQPPVTDEEFDYIRGVFDSSGITAVIDESQMDAVIGVSGSAPAFVFRFAKCIIESGVSAGLSVENATKLMTQTLVGGAGMINESGMSVDELIKMVSSPNGTTVAGLKALDEHNFDEATRAGADASIARSYELCK